MWSWVQSWFPGLPDLPSLPVSLTGDLASEVATQLAQADRPIRDIEAIDHPRRFVDAPANNLGAQLRVAYWLAVASRIALGNGRFGDAAELRRVAEQAQGAAWQMTAQRFASGGFGTSPSGTSAINSILREGATAARQGHEEMVARVLDLQRQSAAQEATQLATAGKGLFTIPGVDPDRLLRWGTGATTALALTAGGVVVLFGLWSIWPWLSPIIGLVRAPFRARARQKRRTR